MSLNILTTRPLPLPKIELGGKDVEWVPLGSEGVETESMVLVSTSLDAVNATLIESLPDTVKLIANLGIGVDHIDFDAAKSRGIIVSNTPVVTEDTADLTFALILAACRMIGANERFVRAGKWSGDMPMAAMGRRVHGQTLGLIGFGKIGQAVARRAHGFDMPVLFFDPYASVPEDLAATPVASIDDLVAQSDIVSLHTPLLPETRHIIDADRLKKFRPGAVLVNAARGPLVDEAALAAALKSGQIGAAGLDVFEEEPSVHPDLFECESLVLTPHIGSATEACRKDIVMRGLQNVRSFLETGAAIDTVISG